MPAANWGLVYAFAAAGWLPADPICKLAMLLQVSCPTDALNQPPAGEHAFKPRLCRACFISPPAHGQVALPNLTQGC